MLIAIAALLGAIAVLLVMPVPEAFDAEPCGPASTPRPPRAGTGSDGAIDEHSSSETIHDREFLLATNGPTILLIDSRVINDFCQEGLRPVADGLLVLHLVAELLSASMTRCVARCARLTVAAPSPAQG